MLDFRRAGSKQEEREETEVTQLSMKLKEPFYVVSIK